MSGMARHVRQRMVIETLTDKPDGLTRFEIADAIGVSRAYGRDVIEPMAKFGMVVLIGYSRTARWVLPQHAELAGYRATIRMLQKKKEYHRQESARKRAGKRHDLLSDAPADEDWLPVQRWVRTWPAVSSPAVRWVFDLGGA